MGTVFSKLSLIFMTKHVAVVDKPEEVNFFWLCRLVAFTGFSVINFFKDFMEAHFNFCPYFSSILSILCLPHLLTFLRALMRLILNGERWPAFSLVVLVVTIDALHAFGVVLLVSKVFPQV